MYQISFNNPIHVHFMGIGGISMSGLAQILIKRGFTISGSDSKKSPLTTELEEMGAKVFYAQVAENITKDIDLLVYTAAISKDNPELNQAKKMGIPCMSRADLLGEIMENFASSICVCGTHGKTTTTSMVSHILLAAAKDPTITVGGILKAIDGNIRIGKSDYFVAEACEYTNSFLSFYPKYNIILNIEEDHMDFFKDLSDIRNSFGKFASNTKADGLILINEDIDKNNDIVKDASATSRTFGFSKNADCHPENLTYDSLGCGKFDIIYLGKTYGQVSLSVPGSHNVSNALSAAALGIELGIDFKSIQEGLSSFTGADRRFEKKGELNGITILDDYAHHPTEISATLSAAKNTDAKRIVVVFQPHTYTRTKAFLEDFAKALSVADMVVLADIYAAREKNTIGISSMDLKEKIDNLGTECYYFPSFDEIKKFLLEKCMNGDLLITMGAGNVVEIGESLLKGEGY